MRERLAYMFMIAILILLIAVTFGVLGKGEYQPPKEEEGRISGTSARISSAIPVTSLMPLI